MERTKYKYLEEFLLVDVSKLNLEDELDYTQENAELLMRNSGDFDQWVTDTVGDLGKFYSQQVEQILALIKRSFIDTGIDIDKYLAVCEQLNQEPDPENASIYGFISIRSSRGIFLTQNVIR